MINLKAKPFYLDDEAIRWVEQTKAGLSLEDKVGQLFCVCCRAGTEEEVDWIYDILNPGTVLLRQLSIQEGIAYNEYLDKRAKIPLLKAANLELGGDGIASEGTCYGAPMAIAASGKVENAGALGRIAGLEGREMGVNWALAPLVDIDYNWRSPIMNVRTFGGKPEQVRDMGRAYVEEIQKLGLAACPKHFPGDGRDERDQHLVVSVNDMSCEDWDKTYGENYRACIEAGTLSIMIGHIMLPAYERFFCPDMADKDMLPATLSPVLMKKLLREKLGFNGLIATDATTMAGFIIPMDRARAIPTTIQNGADVLLMSRNLKEDYRFMLDGVKNGLLTEERLDEAVTRILAAKAALGLHKSIRPLSEERARSVIGCAEHKQASRALADEAVTLVKEEKGVLPITPDRYKRILLYPIETTEKAQGLTAANSAGDRIKELLEKEGFEVDVYVPYTEMEGNIPPYTSIVGKYDLILYIANLVTKSNQTVVRIEWKQPFGSNTPVYVNTVPTVFVSVANPYHLVDVPRVKTFINAYSASDESIAAVLDKLMGRGEFTGVSPVDPFCGKWDARL